MKKIFIALLIILPLNFAYAKNMAVMLYVADKEYGDQIYENYTKEFGLSRNLNSKDKSFNYEYHVTIGYIDRVKAEDAKDLKDYIISSFKSQVSNITEFEFGSTALLGKKNNYVVALANNPEVFISYNQALNELLKTYKSGKYRLNDLTTPEKYLPHLSLNGMVKKEISLTDLPKVLKGLNEKMKNVKIKLELLEVR